MLRVLLLAAVALTVSAGGPSCRCGPEKFMGSLGTLVGQSDETKGPIGDNILEYGAWDFTDRKFGYNMTVVPSNGKPAEYGVIMDYKKGSMWLWIETLKFCLMQDPPKPEPSNCVPDDAVFYGTVNIGSSPLVSEIWSKMYSPGSGPLVGLATTTVEHKTCFPLGSQFMGNNNETGVVAATVSSSGWFNMTVGIPRPSDWFTLPSYCQTQENDSVWPENIPKFFPSGYF